MFLRQRLWHFITIQCTFRSNLSVFAALLVSPYLQIKSLTGFIKKVSWNSSYFETDGSDYAEATENAMDLEFRDPNLSFKKSRCMTSSNSGGEFGGKQLSILVVFKSFNVGQTKNTHLSVYIYIYIKFQVYHWCIKYA